MLLAYVYVLQGKKTPVFGIATGYGMDDLGLEPRWV
jgi:hypothetical protein